MAHPTPALSVTRVGKRTYRGSNGRGDELLIGPADVPGAFSPGELLRLALAACNGMSTDHRLAHELGPEHAAVIEVVGLKNDEEERYEHFVVTLIADLSALSDERKEVLHARAGASVEKNCTVGRTLTAGATYEFRILED